MNFTFETQGAITYLVCELDAFEQIDGLTLGMLTNNHIFGLAPMLYTEMNGARYLKYNISAKLTADQFFAGSISKDRLLTALQNIVNALCSADEYMIDQSCFSLASEHVFINVSSCEVALICIPVAANKDFNLEICELFGKILNSVQVSPSEQGYVSGLLDYVNDSMSFNIYGLRDLITKYQSSAVAPSMNAQVNIAPQINNSAINFDSTISIDDMPGIMGGNSPQSNPVMQGGNNFVGMTGGMAGMNPVQTPVQTPVQAPVQPPIQPPVYTPPQPPVQTPVQPPVYTPPQPPVQAPVQKAPDFGSPIPVNNGIFTSPTAQPVNIPAAAPAPTSAPAKAGPGFAIPGQPVGAVQEDDGKKKKKEKKEKKEKAPKAEKQPKVTESANGEKKMSFMNLMAHYNKENAAIYKAQKEAAKQEKANAKESANVPQQPPVQNGFNPMGMNQGMTGNSMTGGFQGGMNPNPIQPLPVQSSFNETTVLSNFGGETTVLSGNAPISEPALIRVKTGERIAINKPVFRIGKEKSYVDYFIGDNTAISRSHANIHCENGEYFVEDTNSTNHTYVNGNIVVSNVKTKIANGDKVRLANEDFIFSC